MFESGFLTLTRFRGTPLRLHWTLPLGALVFTGMRFEPVAWLVFAGLVLAHEFGHALLVWRFRHRVLSIDVTGFGGLCRWSGAATTTERGAIAWGGVLAQAALLVLAVGARFFFGPPTTYATAVAYSVLTSTNLTLIALNLIPLPPLDGAEAWPLVGSVWRRWRARRFDRPAPRPKSVPPVAKGRTGPLSTDAALELADLLRKTADAAAKARRGSD